MSIEGRQERDAKVGQILLWEGRVSRGRLVTEFGLSPIRASEWLRDFRESYPDWVTWDSKRKADVATSMAYSDAERAANASRPSAISAMLVPHALNAPGKPLSISWDFAHTSPRIFSRLSLAIADRLRVKFLYCSMNNPEPHERIVEPHSLLRAGRRWHVRGYCLHRQDFRDFVLGRMSNIKLLSEPSLIDVSTDVAWSTVLQVRIAAHPSLAPSQQLVVRSEYFNGASARIESCRAALLKYMVQELMAATDIDRQMPPDYQMAVENTEECRQWLFKT
ncbi:WYL domain-containing protein [Burkholderia cepacia]|uniref:WYL domain-containing protein n=1 Tax=Burkholderia cepacia TaxID=292 RepID=UPI001CF2E1F0|nr:WYL domain-containing protein [Burkholderia cepacia]MCA8024728.1 WYL domain-containing protein [Burkholderia cepacia]